MAAFAAVRQVTRRFGVQRRQEQERAGLFCRDKFSRKFAREVKPGLDIDRPHPFPGLFTDGQCMVRLAARRRGAVDEMRDLPDGGDCIRKERLACLGIGQITDPRHR